MYEAHRETDGRMPLELFWLGCAATGFILTISMAWLLSVTAGVI